VTVTPLDAVACVARLALLQAGGDSSGVETLARVWVRTQIGATAGPELVEPRVARVLDMAHSMLDAFNEQQPGFLGVILAANERQLIDQLDDDDDE
jgi:hypothetical protein